MKLLNLLTAFSIGVLPIAASALNADENLYQIHQQAAISSAAGTPWNADQHVRLVEKATVAQSELAEDLHKRTYPISEEDLQSLYSDKSTVTFFAYSSMIDKEAGAVKAISPEGAATQEAAIGFGYQRTFNREMAAATVEGGWGTLKRPNDLAILNIFPKKDAVLNGVIFELPLSDLLVLTKREVGYDLVPIYVMRWKDGTEKDEPEMFLAYTFQAPKGSYTNENINPIPGYFNYLQKGLDLMGKDFKAMWWGTTYLADQTTLVKELPYRSIDMKK
jgi:cation transport regulator ChaC